jgi:hypothetical protein
MNQNKENKIGNENLLKTDLEPHFHMQERKIICKRGIL